MAAGIPPGTAKAGDGDITGVTAGNGLSGGGTSATVTLALDLGTNPGLEIDGSAKLQIAKGISQHDVAQFGAGVDDSDFLRVDGTIIVGLSAAEVAAAIEGSIDAVGTIASGTWQGTTIAVDQGGTGATSLSNLITLATHTTGDFVGTITAGTGLTSTGATSGEDVDHSLSVDAAQTGITSLGTQLANFAVGNTYGVIIGNATQETVSIGDGATDLVPELQVLGTAAADSSMLLAAFSTAATTTGSPIIALAKGGNATLGSHTIVTDGEELGNIIAFGDDGVDLETPAASIQFEVDGTPGAGDMPGRILLNTTADGATALTERIRITSHGEIGIAGANYGTDGQVLTSGGSNAAVAWEDAGGGGGSAVFTADGTITTGAMVTSSSTAGRVKQATTGHGTWSHISHKLAVNAETEQFTQFENSIIWCDDSDTAANNRVAVVYRDFANDRYLGIQIGQYIVADEQVVWGPRTLLNSAAVEGVRAAWDKTRDRIVITYVLASTGDLHSLVCAIDTGETGQSSVIVTSGNTAPAAAQMVADVSALSLSAVQNRIGLAANCIDTDDNPGHVLVTFECGTRIKAAVGIPSGTYFNTVTWAAVQVVDDVANRYNDSLAWDTNVDRGISTYYGSSSTDMFYRVIEIENDDTITAGTAVEIGTAATPLGTTAGTSVVFDDTTNNVVVVYMDSDRHYINGGTLAADNTASWGTAVSLDVWFGAKPAFNQSRHGYLMSVDTDSEQIVLVGAIGGEYSGDGSPSMSQLEGRLAMDPATTRGFGVYLASLGGTGNKEVTVVNAEPMLVGGQSIKQTWVQPQVKTTRKTMPEYRARGITYDTIAKRIYTIWSIEWPGGLAAAGVNGDMFLGVCKVIKAPYTPPSWIGDTGFVGFATTGASNGNPVTVTVAGGTNEDQALLVAGQRYVMFDDGKLRKPSDLVNKDLLSSASRTGSLYDIKQAKSMFSIWKHEVGVATDTDKLFVNFHGGLDE